MKTPVLKRGLALLTLLAISLAPAIADNHKENHKKTQKDIVETAVTAGTFKTLATALTKAGLIETLKGDGPFTVFAPNDEAFAKIPKATLENLLKDKAQLTRVLLFHVVEGKVMSSDVVKLSSAKTVEGSNAKVTVDNKSVMVDNATVIAADLEASNGVIHVIDTVMMPPAPKTKR